MNYKELRNKFTPEYSAIRIYNYIFTPIRVEMFLLLLAFCIVDFIWLKLDFTKWFTLWNQELLNSIAVKMVYLLLAIGSFTATFFTICIEIIKTKHEAVDVTYLWSNLVKYTVYPFVVVLIIGAAIFFRHAGLNQNISFPVFLLFAFLTLNSFYTTIKMAQILVEGSWSQEKKEFAAGVKIQ
ncbi:MAG: hypothetical protein UY15_C0011G0005 [Parcubacteria group bacterium GW2011_GWA2_47_9]|nr:MAG: hypothetical protein UY15_C0011G0005 [Parcubacteria group bacterium GW2011_GWA2_47_9]